MKLNRIVGIFTTAAMLMFTGCMKRAPQVLSTSCSGLSANGITYYSSASDCSAATGNSNCQIQALQSGTLSQLCYYSPSSNPLTANSPALVFSTGSSQTDFGAITTNTTRQIQIENNGFANATGCSVSLTSGSTRFQISTQIPSTVAVGQSVSFTVGSIFASGVGAVNGNFTVSCSNASTNGSVIANFGTPAAIVTPVIRVTSSTGFTIPGFPQSQTSVTRTLTLSNVGTAAASNCNLSLIDSNTNDPLPASSATISPTSISTLATGADQNLTLTVYWNQNSRVFAVKTNCSNLGTPSISDRITVEAYSGPSFAFSPNTKTVTFVSNPQNVSVSLVNSGGSATNCSLVTCGNSTCSTLAAFASVSVSGVTNLNSFSMGASGTSTSTRTVIITFDGTSALTSTKLKLTCGSPAVSVTSGDFARSASTSTDSGRL